MPATHPETELVPYLRQELRGSELARVQTHLERCEQCRGSMEGLATTMGQVAARLGELPAPEWSAYRNELRRKIAARRQPRTRIARTWRPAIAWASLATAAAGLAALVLSFGVHSGSPESTPPVDQLAFEQQIGATDVGLLRNYPVVEHLDLLEDYDVIEHLDEIPSSVGQQGNDSRS